MKILIGLSLIFSFCAFGETYIVEMERPLTPQEITSYQRLGYSLELFDQTQTAYFKRTYSVEASDAEAISRTLPAKTIELIHSAFHTSLEPKKDSKLVRTDELFKLQWGLFNQSQSIKKLIGGTKQVSIEGKVGADIRWSAAIEKVEKNLKKDPVVAVIDMGIDLDHPDLQGQIFKNVLECGPNKEIIDSDEDKDNNGLKGDCSGWNFAARNMHEARRPYDDNGHGTHVAGIIAAQSNNFGITGVSSQVKILPIRVTGNIDEGPDKKNIQPLTDRIAKGILYAANMGVDVINLSLGWTRSMDTKYLNEAIDYALSRGIIIIAAAGNNNNNANILPCSHYDVICVGAATIDGSLADFSNYGGEVDVIAPGDEIVSTIPLQSIPLQLNLQGYDIRSGTSQATPFVSAIAALLRGTYPRLHRDEVIRRIVDAADPGISGKSMNGIVNMKKTFEIPALPSVRPVFKRFSVALYDGMTNNFQFPLMVKNFGFSASQVTVTVKSLSPGFDIAQTMSFPALRPGEVVPFKMKGTVSDTSAHNLVKIEVTVTGENFEQKVFVHEFRLARDVLRDEKVMNLPFEFENGPLPVGILKEGQVQNLINTVEEIHSAVGMPEYYIPRTVKESQAIEVRIFRGRDDKMMEVKGMILLPQAQQILNVMKLDVNLDGEDDYLVRSIACAKFCDDPVKSHRYIQYSFWKKDLSSLFGKKSFWKFLPTLVNVDLKSQRFFKIDHQDFGKILVPMFVETGTIPEDQQNMTEAFALPDRSSGRRIYYLSPEVKENDVVLKTHTIMTSSFLKEIRQKLGAHKSDEVQALHLLAQSASDLAQGQVQAVLSVGRGYLKKNIHLIVDKGSIKVTPFRITQNLWGFEHLISHGLEDAAVADSFAGLISRSRLSMLQTGRAQSYTYDAAGTVEVPLATIASFHAENEEFTFFQTPSYLYVSHHSDQGIMESRMKINRFSFLPGALFNDTFYPVIAQGEGSLVPALYVDETDIQSNLVSLSIYENNQLKSPIKMSAFIPPVCRALNPNRLAKDEGHSLTLLCWDQKQWVLKFFKME
jgi:hypothetical protein